MYVTLAGGESVIAIQGDNRHGITIVGRVTDAETGSPVDGANIYLSNTTIGASTDTGGVFGLRNVPPGLFDLIASRLGYSRQILHLQLTQGDSFYYAIRLTPSAVIGPDVDITAEQPKDWKGNLERFSKLFLGNTNQCRIINPEVLNFRFSNDTLFAWADSALRIENVGLGYGLKAVLADFAWNTEKDYGHYVLYPLFKQLNARDAPEEAQWEENRKKAYEGSLKHFLHSLCLGNSEEELFSVYSGPLKNLIRGQGHQVSAAEFELEPLEGTHLRMLKFSGYLRVEYGRKGDEEQVDEGKYRGRAKRLTGVSDINSVSIISLRGPYALIDSAGNLFNPLSLEVAGMWTTKRVSDLLPMY